MNNLSQLITQKFETAATTDGDSNVMQSIGNSSCPDSAIKSSANDFWQLMQPGSITVSDNEQFIFFQEYDMFHLLAKIVEVLDEMHITYNWKKIIDKEDNWAKIKIVISNWHTFSKDRFGAMKIIAEKLKKYVQEFASNRIDKEKIHSFYFKHVFIELA